MRPNGKCNNAHFARRRQATAPPWALAFDGTPQRDRSTSKENAGRRCAKESSHSATLVPSALPPPTLWPRQEVVAEAYEFRRQMSKFRSPAFPPRCGKSITVGIDPSSRMQGQFQGAWHEKANGDRVFCHFIDGRG